MSNIITVTNPDEFADPYFINWAERPDSGRVVTPTAVTSALQLYDYQECAITIDLSGPAVFLQRCNKEEFNYNFQADDGVLLCDMAAGVRRLHLTFSVPGSAGFRAMGSHVSATGPVDADYSANLIVRLSDGTLASAMPQIGRLSRVRDTAPFIGAWAPSGLRIQEAMFSVSNLQAASQFLQLAISGLYFEV